MGEGKAILLSVAVALSLAGGVWGWWVVYRSGQPVSGTRYFRTFFDERHGMASTSGTLEFAGGEKIYLECWSPGTLMRDHFVKFIIYRPSRIGEETKSTMTIKAGALTLAFDGEYGDMAADQTRFWPNYDLTREQLREIIKAHQVEFDVGNERPLILSDDHLADIRAFLASTDKLPEYDPRPPEMRTNSP